MQYSFENVNSSSKEHDTLWKHAYKHLPLYSSWTIFVVVVVDSKEECESKPNERVVVEIRFCLLRIILKGKSRDKKRRDIMKYVGRNS